MGNIALIITLPVLVCLNSVQHLQPRCLEHSFFPHQNRKNDTSKTPEGRSATFGVRGLVFFFFFQFFGFFPLMHFFFHFF